MDALRKSKLIAGYPASSTIIVNNITYASLDVLTVRRELTVTELYSLHLNPILLTTPPGNNKFIEIVSADATLNFGTTAYSAPGMILSLGSESIISSVAAQCSFGTAFLQATSTRTTKAQINASSGTNQIVTGDRLAVKLTGPGGIPIANGDSTITVYVAYIIKKR